MCIRDRGLKVLELGLHFGGNDVGSVMLEENVVRAAGTSNCTTEAVSYTHLDVYKRQVGGTLHARVYPAFQGLVQSAGAGRDQANAEQRVQQLSLIHI